MTDELILREEARFWGGIAASQCNKMAGTGVSSMVEYGRIGHANDRVAEIAAVIGEGANEAYAEGFDEEIDFSLNADWRLTASD